MDWESECRRERYEIEKQMQNILIRILNTVDENGLAIMVRIDGLMSEFEKVMDQRDKFRNGGIYSIMLGRKYNAE